MSGDLLEYRVFSRPPGGGPSEAGPWQPAVPGTYPLPRPMAIEIRATPLPSAEALRAYLAATGWYGDCETPDGTLWVKGPHRVVIGSRSPVEVIALAEGRSPGDVARAVNALQGAPGGHSGAPPADDTGREPVTVPDDAQDRAGASRARSERDLIHADLGQLLDLLGLGDYARPESPHEVFQQCIREVARVIDRNGVLGRIIGSASRELRKAGRDD